MEDMKISDLLLAITLLIWSAIGFGWLPWPLHVVYVFAFGTGVVIVLELLSVIKWRWPNKS